MPKYIFLANWREKEGLFFLEWKSIDLSSKSIDLSLTCKGNVNYYKIVHHPITTRGNREHPGNFQDKSVSSPLDQVCRYILFSAKLKGRRRPFLGEHCDITPKSTWLSWERWKSLPFCEVWIIQPVLCFLLDHLTNKHCWIWSSYIEIPGPFKSKESCCLQGKGLYFDLFLPVYFLKWNPYF